MFLSLRFLFSVSRISSSQPKTVGTSSQRSDVELNFVLLTCKFFYKYAKFGNKKTILCVIFLMHRVLSLLMHCESIKCISKILIHINCSFRNIVRTFIQLFLNVRHIMTPTPVMFDLTEASMHTCSYFNTSY